MADKKQRLVYSILEFLQSSMDDGSIKQDDKEGVEVAIQCIAEAFSIDTSNSKQTSELSIKPSSLSQIFDVYLKTQAKQSKAAPAASTSAGSSAPSLSKEDEAAAEKLKTQGNALMASKKYAEAIEKYTEAIAINGKNPVYYSNRAAAHSQAGDHELAIDDAEKAKGIDPNFAKAYSRAGHAYFSLGRYGEAAQSYERAVELDPTNASMKSSLATAKAKAANGEASDDVGSRDAVSSPPPSGGGNPFAGLAGLGGGGGGGMPDLASLMNNPQLMQMAQQMMANGGLDRIMQNPMMRQMAERFQSGGGMPDMSEMMNNPEMRRMAEQFGGSMGGGGGAGSHRGGSNNSNNSDMYS